MSASWVAGLLVLAVLALPLLLEVCGRARRVTEPVTVCCVLCVQWAQRGCRCSGPRAFPAGAGGGCRDAGARGAVQGPRSTGGSSGGRQRHGRGGRQRRRRRRPATGDWRQRVCIVDTTGSLHSHAEPGVCCLLHRCRWRSCWTTWRASTSAARRSTMHSSQHHQTWTSWSIDLLCAAADLFVVVLQLPRDPVSNRVD